ncbi:hypothetical protein OKW43_002760 [Paraburkholderia sp. WC7.3g]|uniref:EcoRII N-terminal effector-binding domain-containing protein n=1 Tax=Paraburkholderia sp. WC7.3g TaxID=2991070 RepID=UPI003D1A2679
MKKISKRLSANDIGLTGAHQAGILVPKQDDILNFFPPLNRSTKNPRVKMLVRESVSETPWTFNFIFYNNRLFGGTRNEYRLTCMTQYLRAVDAKVDDELVFSKNENGSVYVARVRPNGPSLMHHSDDVLVLSGGWKIINIA